jgi:hypothetical protein
MTTIALGQLACVRGGEAHRGERALTDRLDQEFPRRSTRREKFEACLMANQPRKDVDDITWPEAMAAALKCEAKVLLEK